MDWNTYSYKGNGQWIKVAGPENYFDAKIRQVSIEHAGGIATIKPEGWWPEGQWVKPSDPDA